MNAIQPIRKPAVRRNRSVGTGRSSRRVHPWYMTVLSLTLILCAGLASVAFTDTARASALPLPQPSVDIPCEESPFGYRLPIGGDYEMVDLMDFGSLSNPELFEEWELSSSPDPDVPPLTQSIDSSWTYFNENALAGSTLLRAVRANLDGDGSDEILVAVRMPNGYLRLGVIRREPYTTSTPIELFSTWTLNAQFEDLEIAVGDLDGSQDGRDEIAVMVRVEDPTRLMVFVLTGNDEGGIAENDNSWSGFWSWQPPSSALGVSDITAGDVLLNGRDQMVIVAESDQQGAGNNRKLNYHLLEFEPPSGHVLPIEPGNIAIASGSWSTLIGNILKTGRGGSTDNDIHESGGIANVKALAGDVTGDAAEEVMILYDFKNNLDDYRVVARLHHFRTTRDANNAITAIDLAKRNGAVAGVDYDDSIIVRTAASTSGRWDATVYNVDTSAKSELVIATEQNQAGTRYLDMAIYQPTFELTAGFRYHHEDNEVQFENTSLGMLTNPDEFSRTWNFGDGETTDVEEPVHEYDPNLEVASVTLTLHQRFGLDQTTSVYPQTIQLDSGTSDGDGPDPGSYFFVIPRVPAYHATYYPEQPLSQRAFDPIRISAGDMDRDGRIEIMSFARFGLDNTSGSGWLRSVWHVDPDALIGQHMLEPTQAFMPNSDLADMFVVAADFDGDSIEATISADCRAVVEAQMRQLIWAPPYFAQFQTSAPHSASFGMSTTQGTDVEHQFGTFTSHSISGYIGTELGFDLFGLVGASASVRATAGHNEQAAHGGIVGSQNSHALDEGYAQETYDALLTFESNHFNCYSYDVRKAGGEIDPYSSLRICEIIDPEHLTSMNASDPRYWNREFPQPWASGAGGHTPPNWAPITRDWNSIALFRTPSTNATFAQDLGPDQLTDGRFTTYAESEPMFQPYVQIDLGTIRSIGNIRVFAPDECTQEEEEQGDCAPEDQYAVDLTGFRIYTSTTPMSGSGLPSGPDVHVFTPDAFNGAVLDRWNVWTRVWGTGDPETDGDPIPMRYIRLQHPDNARVRAGEIQVFADDHVDPPRYPAAICDSVQYDGLFKAKVWDPEEQQFRPVEVHGDLLWTGTGPAAELPSWGADSQYLTPCTNDPDLQGSEHNFTIWDEESIGTSGTYEWGFATTSGTSTGETTSLQTSNRVGAEFDATLNAIVSIQTGGAEEFETGVTEEHQSVSYWSEGIDMGGSISGFQSPYNTAHYVDACKYNARPYAYKLVEKSDVGYEHTLYVVDYVVPDGPGPNAWTRATLPPQCQPPSGPPDTIFRSGFDG